MNETKEFILWKKDNIKDLENQYREYLRDTVANDLEFNVDEVELFETWLEVEFDVLKERELEEKEGG